MLRATVIIVMGITVLVFILFAEYKCIKETIPKDDFWIKRPKDTGAKCPVSGIGAFSWDLRPLEEVRKMFKSNFV